MEIDIITVKVLREIGDRQIGDVYALDGTCLSRAIAEGAWRNRDGLLYRKHAKTPTYEILT